MFSLTPDTGSQHTYISNDLKNYLILPVLPKEQILIKVSGSEDTCIKIVDILPLKITSPIKTIIIEGVLLHRAPTSTQLLPPPPSSFHLHPALCDTLNNI